MRFCHACAQFIGAETGTCEVCEKAVCPACTPAHEASCGRVVVEALQLTLGDAVAAADTAANDDVVGVVPGPEAIARENAADSAPTALWASERRGPQALPCRHCGKGNPLPRLWCIACGHGLGMGLDNCVCETCLKG